MNNEEVYVGIRKLLNEAAAVAMSNIKIPKPGQRTKKRKTKQEQNQAVLYSGEYIIYRDLSMKGHLSPWGTRGQVKLKEQTLYYRFGPTKEKEEIISALDFTHLCFLLILMRLSSYFGIESDQKQKLNWHIKLRNKNLRNEAE